MHIGITGSTGFIGQNLVPELLKRGHKVKVLVRDPHRKILWDDVEKVEGNFQTPDALQQFLMDVEAVVHCAGAIRALRMEDYVKGNYTTTKILVDAINQFKPKDLKKFVFLSSQSAQGPSVGLAPRRFDEPPSPVTWYGKSKLMAENYIVNYLEYPYIILRLALVYGPGDRETFRFFQYVKKGIFPMPNGEKYLSVVYVKDVVRLIMFILEMENHIRSRIYFVAHPQYHSLSEIVDGIKSLFGKKKVAKLSIPEAIFRPALKVNEIIASIACKATIANSDKANELAEKYWIGDPAPLIAETGFKPEYSLMEGLFETLEWYKKEGWL